MKIPESVKIGPYTYAVETVDDLSHDEDKNCKLWGHIHFESQKIRLATYNRLPFETLLHEAIHGIDEVYGINLKEKQVKRLATGLYSFLVENNMLRED